MRFDAIVHAPTLRAGARLNIAAADQSLDRAPCRFGSGASVRLRFGVCCPDLAGGTIAATTAVDPETLVMVVDGVSWTLVRSVGGITDPGLLSETWFVAGRDSTR